MVPTVKPYGRLSMMVGILSLIIMACCACSAWATGYKQINLVSDLQGVARFTDSRLINPWGLNVDENGVIRVADNGTGLSTAYEPNGRPIQSAITIPPPKNGMPPSAPTGLVENETGSFVIRANGRSAPSQLLFATEDGTVSGWNPNVDQRNAILAFDNSAKGSVFKGIALGRNTSGDFLFVTDFHNGVVIMLNKDFKPVKSFFDPKLSPPPIGHPGFAPFGIRNIGGVLVVTYALQNAAQHDDVAGVGNGFVDIFDTKGNFIKRFASRGTLNSPWGLVLAGNNFGQFSNALLVGDFGDGLINAFNPKTGAFLGQLRDTRGKLIKIDGLWSVTFAEQKGNNNLYFTAGINHEADGLLGVLVPE